MDRRTKEVHYVQYYIHTHSMYTRGFQSDKLLFQSSLIFTNLKCQVYQQAQMYLQPLYRNGFFGNVYLSAGWTTLPEPHWCTFGPGKLSYRIWFISTHWQAKFSKFMLIWKRLRFSIVYLIPSNIIYTSLFIALQKRFFLQWRIATIKYLIFVRWLNKAKSYTVG